MEIRTKFNKDDKVFHIRQVYKKIICPACKGVGKFMIDDVECICNTCKGDKKIFIEQMVWIVDENIYQIGKIVIVSRYTKENSIEYYRNTYGEQFIGKEQNCFATKEEAQKECDKRNGKE